MRNDSIERAAEIFAEAEHAATSAGAMIAVPDEVWSYNERVAFRGEDDQVYVTKQSFSTTTSKHVGFVRRALSRAGYITDGTEVEGWEVWSRRR